MLANRDPSGNMCETGKMQSPIDVRENGAVCDEHHEVRSLVSFICVPSLLEMMYCLLTFLCGRGNSLEIIVLQIPK